MTSMFLSTLQEPIIINLFPDQLLALTVRDAWRMVHHGVWVVVFVDYVGTVCVLVWIQDLLMWLSNFYRLILALFY